ncbi:MAG: hypothetical protein ACRDYW_06500 [Acidimicrobiales bacterium]
MADRSSLLAAKLGSLVSAQFGSAPREAVDFPGGAGLVGDGVAFLLLDADPLKAFGPALVWAARQDADEVHLLVDSQGDVLARRAGCFRQPPSVWTVDGSALVPAEPAPPAVAAPAPAAPDLATLLVDAGLEVVVEEGMVRGEVLGLEVARIVHGETSTGTPIDAPLLEVGVGHADRELTALLHAGLSPVAQLARVIDIVRVHRRSDAERHPLNQLALERWMRARLVSDPGRIGLSRLRPIAPAVPRPNLRDPAVAMALGEDGDGAPVVVACSVGIDLDLVPAAADARLSAAPDARLLLVVPARDAHPVTRDLADRLAQAAEVVPLEGDWRRAQGGHLSG